MKLNKKGGTILSLIGLMTVIVFISIVISAVIQVDLLNKECKDMGYKEYEKRNNFDFCESNNGNLYYINYDCDYKVDILKLIPKDCSAYKIRVGDKDSR